MANERCSHKSGITRKVAHTSRNIHRLHAWLDRPTRMSHSRTSRQKRPARHAIYREGVTPLPVISDEPAEMHQRPAMRSGRLLRVPAPVEPVGPVESVGPVGPVIAVASVDCAQLVPWIYSTPSIAPIDSSKPVSSSTRSRLYPRCSVPRALRATQPPLPPPPLIIARRHHHHLIISYTRLVINPLDFTASKYTA